MISRLVRRSRNDDAGFTLIELVVAMVLMGLVGTALLTVVFGANDSSKQTRSQQDLNEEARDALNRMARELRQANGLTSVLNPDGPSYNINAITAVTFTADFNGDGCINGVAPSPLPSPAPTCTAYDANNPEVLTYCWDPSASVQQLYLIPGTLSGSTCQVTGAQPILAGKVTAFKLTYRSNQYLYDTNGDGITSWLEIDQADPPTGDGNGTLDANELKWVDSVVIDVTVADSGAHPQKYTTQVDLRNLS